MTTTEGTTGTRVPQPPDWVDLDKLVPADLRERMVKVREEAERLEPVIRNLIDDYNAVQAEFDQVTSDRVGGDSFVDVMGWAGTTAMMEAMYVITGHLSRGMDQPNTEPYVQMCAERGLEPIEPERVSLGEEALEYAQRFYGAERELKELKASDIPGGLL